MEKTTKFTFTWGEKADMVAAYWGAFTRESNAQVGRTVAKMLEDGVSFPKDDYKVAQMVAKESGVSEMTDTMARDQLCTRLEMLLSGVFPVMRPDTISEDWDDDEYDDDEDDEDAEDDDE